MMKFLYALLVALLLAATNVVSASVALSEDPASEVALPLDISSEDLASIKLPDGLDFAITKLIQDAIYVKVSASFTAAQRCLRWILLFCGRFKKCYSGRLWSDHHLTVSRI
jgi:hypothetical protein